jgi:FtsP/CotA-like multicopper oxidase with cupredoxin domain
MRRTLNRTENLHLQSTGPIVIHGPATANYDEELDTVMITDWDHETADSLYTYAQVNGPVPMDTGLINGLNVYGDTGARYEAAVESGKSYLLRYAHTSHIRNMS